LPGFACGLGRISSTNQEKGILENLYFLLQSPGLRPWHFVSNFGGCTVLQSCPPSASVSHADLPLPHRPSPGSNADGLCYAPCGACSGSSLCASLITLDGSYFFLRTAERPSRIDHPGLNSSLLFLRVSRFSWRFVAPFRLKGPTGAFLNPALYFPRSLQGCTSLQTRLGPSPM